MKLAIGYSTKDQVELTEKTLLRTIDCAANIYWCDGSSTNAGCDFLVNYPDQENLFKFASIRGGADAAIAWKLSTMLAAKQNYTHIGLLESDVLLDPNWLEPTLELFEKGKADGLHVGAVSPRSYADRVLIQREGWAVMHNIGAGVIIFTREAAEIILRSFRTQWWPDNVKLFAQISGIDLRTYACFRGNAQWVTTDWGWEAQLARHGLASLALTPAKCQMIGQNPPLEQQDLELTTGSRDKFLGCDGSTFRDTIAFACYRDNLDAIRKFKSTYELPDTIHRDGAGMLFFPHQLGGLNAGLSGDWTLKWSQGFGPFAYQAGTGRASLSVLISGSCSFLAAGGDAGASVTIDNHRSGFKTAPNLPPGADLISIQVPGGPIPQMITVDFADGAIFYGLQTAESQMLHSSFKFDWARLPEPL